jgi:hypothetical protein
MFLVGLAIVSFTRFFGSNYLTVQVLHPQQPIWVCVLHLLQESSRLRGYYFHRRGHRVSGLLFLDRRSSVRGNREVQVLHEVYLLIL